MYDVESGRWNKDEDGLTLEPKSIDTYKFVLGLLNISKNVESGVITINFSHFSPHEAYRISQLLIRDLNEHFRLLAQDEAKASIEFLEKKIAKTSNTEMRQVFFSLIEGHSKTLMMTEIRAEYLLKTLIPTMIPQKKDRPKRALIVVVGGLFGGFLSIAFVLGRFFVNQK